MQKEKLSRREREKLRQRQEMLDAALLLFSEKGYHNVSMHEIAEKAEFAIGTLYKFFKNKEDLYRSMMKEQADEFHSLLGESLIGPDNEIDKICRYIRVKGGIFTRKKQMIQLYFAETRGVSHNQLAGMDSEACLLHREGMKKLAAVFETGIEKGYFQPVAEPFYLAIALDNLISSFLFLWIEDPEAHPFPQSVENIKAIFFHQILNSKEDVLSC
ncbi:MAG: TetR/AcrR family transcriptional regulator [Holophagae bacterium]|nr:TetR/AcrR family transcriptional regulator [Holophagae bacterium]